MNVIETKRLILRKPDWREVDALIAFYISERSSMAGGNVSHTEAVTRAYAMLGHWEHKGFGLFTMTRKGDDIAVGMAGPYFPEGRPETEIGWILFEGAEGNGYATEAAEATIRYSKEILGWNDIVHYIDKDNIQSIAVAERLGAKLDLEAIQPKPENPCLVYRQKK